MNRLGILLNIDFFIIMRVEIASGKIYFFLMKRADIAFRILTVALHHQQQLTKVHFKQFLVSDTAILQLLNHSSKQLLIDGCDACIEVPFIQGNVIAAKDVFHITPGEMQPEDFRFVLGIVFIMLFLSGLKQDHMPGRNIHYLFSEEEASFASGNVNKLEVKSAFGTPCREFFFVYETIRPTTADNQRF